jgi:hypothetical protein
MDLHVIEVGVVTTLSIWVYLFSPSGISRMAAAAMFFLNLIWVIFEREHPDTGKQAPRPQRRPEPPAEEGEAAGTQTDDAAPRSPRVI